MWRHHTPYDANTHPFTKADTGPLASMEHDRFAPAQREPAIRMSGRLALGWVAAICFLGLVLGSLDLIAPTGIFLGDTTSDGAVRMLWQLALTLCVAAAVFLVARRGWISGIPAFVVIVAALVGTVAIAYTAAAICPNSGDEYGYVYAARTLLHWRTYNPPPPVPGLFDFSWIGIRDGKMASQYAPGWPAVLSPFVAMHIAPLANPLLTVALGVLLLACLRQLEVPATTSGALLALVMLSPFTLFNGASLFNHMQAAVAVLAVCWFQLRDEATERILNKLLIGFFLSITLITRTEVFAITAFVLGIDYLVRLRLNAFRAVPPLIAGALPVTALWLAYNRSITGDALLPIYMWASPGLVEFRVTSLGAILHPQGNLAISLLRFSSGALLLLYLFALWTRLRSGTIRFYDLLLPAGIIFLIFCPSWPGHQFGPRYWFFAWPTIALTIGSTLSTRSPSAFTGALTPGRAGFVNMGQWRVHLPTLAAAQLVSYVSFAVVFTAVLRDYVDARQVVYTTPVPRQPAIVLVPNREFRLSPWQTRPFFADAKDFTRNGFGYNAPVLYGRGDNSHMVELACTLPGRTVYVWQSATALRTVDCQL